MKIIVACLALFLAGCSISPRTLIGRPAEATARDHSADGGKATLVTPDGAKITIQQPDNPAGEANVRVKRVIERFTPAPTPGPQSSLTPDPFRGFATIPAFRLFASAKVQQPPPPDFVGPPAPDQVLTERETITYEATVSGAQLTHQIILAVFTNPKQFMHIVAGLWALWYGRRLITAENPDKQWPNIGWALAIGGAVTVYGTLVDYSWAQWALPVAGVVSGLIYFIYSRFGQAVITVANPAAGAIVSAITGAKKP